MIKAPSLLTPQTFCYVFCLSNKTPKTITLTPLLKIPITSPVLQCLS